MKDRTRSPLTRSAASSSSSPTPKAESLAGVIYNAGRGPDHPTAARVGAFAGVVCLRVGGPRRRFRVYRGHGARRPGAGRAATDRAHAQCAGRIARHVEVLARGAFPLAAV